MEEGRSERSGRVHEQTLINGLKTGDKFSQGNTFGYRPSSQPPLLQSYGSTQSPPTHYQPPTYIPQNPPSTHIPQNPASTLLSSFSNNANTNFQNRTNPTHTQSAWQPQSQPMKNTNFGPSNTSIRFGNMDYIVGNTAPNRNTESNYRQPNQRQQTVSSTQIYQNAQIQSVQPR